jgi:hypothetical protein
MNDSQGRLEKYRFLGAMLGTTIGAIASLLLAGPHLHEWTKTPIALTFGGCIALGMLLGYLAIELIVARLAGNSGIGADGIGGSDGGAQEGVTDDLQWHHSHGTHDSGHVDHGGHSD